MLALRGWLLACAVTPAWASHPLLTEDTDVLGKRTRELELHGERSRDREAGVSTRGTEIVLKLGYGVAEKADIEVELPYGREVAGGDAVEGRGDAGLALKWRFYDKSGLSFAFKPELLLATGRDEVGLGAGRTRWGANLAGAYEIGRFELLAHLGYIDNRNRIGEPKSLRHQSIALRFTAAGALRLVADLARESDPEPGGASYRRELVTGAIYELSRRMELGFGIKTGLNDAADDRSLRAGVKLRF